MSFLILGYGDPAAAHYRSEKMVDKVPKTLNFNDTFLDFEHLRQSFPIKKTPNSNEILCWPGSLKTIT